MTLYQLLDEMLDSGIPVNTHPGGLKVLVPPPNLLNRVSSTMFGHQGVLVSDQDPLKLLPLPWRSNNIKYASNEIYLDVIESIDATLDTEGRVLSSAIHGGDLPLEIRLPTSRDPNSRRFVSCYTHARTIHCGSWMW